MTDAIVYYAPSNVRSTMVANAMFEGIKRAGADVQLQSSLSYRGNPKAPVALFYGLAAGLRRIMDDYRRKNLKAFYIDLGYWGRRKKSRWDGYHKIVLNSRHPTAYFQNRPHHPERFNQLNVPILPWQRNGRHIIVAGMSAKAAAAEGFRANEWDRSTIARLRTLTDRPLIYRPKPNWIGAIPLTGASFQQNVELDVALRNCHAVVTHHSNFGVDALLAGVPVFSFEGVASVLGETDIRMIEEPARPAGREQWCHDLAWCQFTMEEMKTGFAWNMLKNEGLIP